MEAVSGDLLHVGDGAMVNAVATHNFFVHVKSKRRRAQEAAGGCESRVELLESRVSRHTASGTRKPHRVRSRVRCPFIFFPTIISLSFLSVVFALFLTIIIVVVILLGDSFRRFLKSKAPSCSHGRYYH